MKIHLQGETYLRLSDFESEGFDVSLESEALYYGALSMFVTSLGRCTYAVLFNYAARLGLEPDPITIELNWDYAEDPTRIEYIAMHIFWPELPDSRRKAVQRASHMCTVHNTIRDCVNIDVTVNDE